jgi:hypothetical protein
MNGQTTVIKVKHHVVLQEGKRERRNQMNSGIVRAFIQCTISISAQHHRHNLTKKTQQWPQNHPDPSKYDTENVAHMRRVAAYCKRHLAQKETAKQDTGSNSYKSLKNWGHDVLPAK